MAYVDYWNASQLLGKRTHWLLDIEYASRIYRLAQQDLEITSTELGVLRYSACITSDITFVNEFSLFSNSANKKSIQIETFLENDDIISLINQGYDISGASVSLSKWIEGQDYDDRRIFIIGRVADPEYGDSSVPLNFSIEESFYDDDSVLPENTAQVCEATAITAYIAKEDIGLYYPIIIGNPGYLYNDISRNNIERLAGSQGIWYSKNIRSQQLVIAGHETSITSVTLINDDLTSGMSYRTTQSEDLLGRKITVISAGYDVPALATVQGSQQGINGSGAATTFQAVYDAITSTNNIDSKVFVNWYPGDADTTFTSPEPGGGLTINGEIIRGAGDVIEYVLGQSKYKIDRNKIFSIKSALNKYRIDCTIDAQVKPWDWVRENIFPLLPVSLDTGVNGSYLIYWNPSATENESICSINSDIDYEVYFNNKIFVDTSRIANDFSIDYSLDIRTDQYQRTFELSKKPSTDYAKTYLTQPSGVIILIEATLPNEQGSNIEIRIESNGINPTSYNEYENYDSTGFLTKTVVIKTQSPGTPPGNPTVQELIDGINNNLAYIRASLSYGDPTQLLNGAYPLDSVVEDAFKQIVYTSTIQTLRVQQSYYCDLSQRRFKKIINDGVFKKSIKTFCVYDEPTAASVLAWQAKAFCFPHKSVEALLPEHKYGWLELGQTVTLTCSRLGLASRVAFIQAIEYGSDGMIACRFTMIEDPIRDGHDY